MDRTRTARIDDVPALYDGLIKLVRSGMGITAFGVNVMDLPPDYRTRSHDESGSGQEELYVGLRGDGAVIVHEPQEERLELGEGGLVAVPPSVPRTLASGPAGARILIIGGTPGKAYEAPAWTEAPDGG